MQLLKDNWLVIWFFGIFFLELIFYHKNYVKRIEAKEHWKTNLLNFIATKLISIIFLISIVNLASKYSTHFLANLSPLISIVLSIFILDFAGYIFHRASHEIEFLWRFHEIHHLDEILDVSTSLRVHFLEAFFHTLVSCLVIYIFGIGQEAIAIHSLIAFVFATYHHSRFKLPINLEKILALFVTTPSFHEPHHDEDIKNNQSNYAFIFPIWDRIFFTYNKRTFQSSWKFGLSYSKDVNALNSLIKPLSKDGGK
ncbi:sterol desaturase family protein (plasmid) [Acinetobacter sp. ESL0695]|uniref:sterol desaturase family protein n=1 Tax=Acinetobacter sp. ESL0695 TaxID=2983215 RepID=UPI0023EF5D45|nr:sterol desaturase family protein [Acinetobacter sp. ESL0695]WEV50201.1 sterol desaturase family protein [Acinetobacter sp. ESL0695]